MELTFNWVYADDRSIAQFTSGRLPVRPPTVDPGLPTKGTGEYEWQGFAARVDARADDQPASGLILNWNNKPARGYAGADDEWTWGPVQRVDLLWAGIQRRPKHTLATVVACDERRRDAGPAAVRVWPVVRDVLARANGTPRATAAAAQLDAWYAAGGSRLDADLDGKVDAPGAAVMDAAWAPIANAVMAPVLDTQARAELGKLVPERPCRSLRRARARTAAGGRTCRRTSARSSAGPSRGRSRRGSAAQGTRRRARRRSGRRSTRRRHSSRRPRGPTPRRGTPTRPPSGSASRPGSSRATMRGSNKPTFQQAITFRSHR